MRCQTKYNTAFHLCFDGIRVYCLPAINSTNHLMNFQCIVFCNGNFSHMGHNTAK